MNMKLYRNEALDVIARKVITQYDPSLLYSPALIPVESIMERIYGLTIEYQHLRKNGRVLGETVFEDFPSKNGCSTLSAKSKTRTAINAVKPS